MKPLIIPTQASKLDQRRCGIYILWDNTKHRVYVGQTCITFRLRWHGHENYLQSEYGSNYLKNAFRKYDKENFEWDIIETLPSHLEHLWYKLLNTKQSERNRRENEYEPILQWLDEREIFWIDFYRKLLGVENVFNTQDGGRKGTRMFVPVTEESRQKISISGKERYKRPGEREKQSKRISNYFNRLFAIPGERDKFCVKRSEDMKRSYAKNPEKAINLSIAQKKSYEKPGRREHMSEVQLIAQGRQEVRDKKSKSMTGIKWSEETQENRAKGIHESWKLRHEMLNDVLAIPIKINPRIKKHSAFVKQMIIRILTLMMHGLVRKKIPLKRCHLTPSVQRRIRCRPDIPHDIPSFFPLFFIQREKCLADIGFQHIIECFSAVFPAIYIYFLKCPIRIQRHTSMIKQISVVDFIHAASF